MTVFEQAARVPKKYPVLFNGAVAILVVVLSLIIYARTFTYSYLDWDDNTLVEQNVYVMQPDRFSTENLWTPGRAPGPYLPLRTISYVVDREVFGAYAKTHDEKGAWHHRVNTWLYIINGLVLMLAFRKLLDPWTAAIATLIWVVHPLHVEGVAWVSGRKEMLAGILMVGSFLSYVLATERKEKAAPALPWGLGALALFAAGSYLLFNWLPLAAKYNLAEKSWRFGALAVVFFSAGLVVLGFEEKQHRARVMFFSVLAFLCGVGALLSKPVAVMLPFILLAWEMGHRPLREKATRYTGRLGTLVVFSLLIGGGIFVSMLFVGHKPPQQALVRGLIAGGAFAAAAIAAAFALPRLPENLQKRARAEFERVVPNTDEAVGLVARSIPYLAIALWSISSIITIASGGSVIKEATWNAAPKVRSVSAFGAIWLDLYHLFVPLNLSALYDVKSDVWYWQAYVGVAILIALPFVLIWIFFRSPKSLVWLAWLVAPIIPVCGIVQIAAAHADRYLYLPAIAVAVALGYLLSTAAFGSDEETGEWERWVAAGLTVAIIGGFTTLSIQRAGVWRNDEQLWGDAVRKNPELPSALNNYGAALMNARKVEQALEQYYRAYKVLPTLDVAQFNIAATELKLGRADRAQKYAEEFVGQHPEMPTGWILLGQLYLTQQRAAEQAGNAALRLQKLESARDAYIKGCGVDIDERAQLQLADMATSCGHLATVYHTLGNTTGMDMAFAKGFKASPNNRILLQLHIRTMSAQKRYAEVHKSLMQFYNLQPSAKLLRQVIVNQIMMDDKQGALVNVNRLLDSRGAEATDIELKRRIEEGIKTGKPVDLKSPTKPPEMDVPLPDVIDLRKRAPGGE